MGGNKDMDKDLGARREDVPKAVKAAWDRYVRTKTGKAVKSKLGAALKDGFRVNKVMMALRKLKEDPQSDFDEDDDPDLQVFLKALQDSGLLFESEERQDSQFGGEAVVTEAALAPRM